MIKLSASSGQESENNAVHSGHVDIYQVRNSLLFLGREHMFNSSLGRSHQSEMWLCVLDPWSVHQFVTLSHSCAFADPLLQWRWDSRFRAMGLLTKRWTHPISRANVSSILGPTGCGHKPSWSSALMTTNPISSFSTANYGFSLFLQQTRCHQIIRWQDMLEFSCSYIRTF